MDFDVAPVVRAALLEAVEREDFGYVEADLTELTTACAEFLAAEHGWVVPSTRIFAVADVLAGIAAALDVFVPPGCAGRRPHAGLPAVLRGGGADRSRGRHCTARHRERPSDPRSRRDRIAAAGGRRRRAAVQPAQPDRARVHRGRAARARRGSSSGTGRGSIADEVHAPLVYGPGRHVPYTTVSDAAAEHAVTVTSASKAFNLAGSQVRADRHHEPRRLGAVAGPARASGRRVRRRSGSRRPSRRTAPAGRGWPISVDVPRRQPPSACRAAGRARPRCRRRGAGGDVPRVARLLDARYRRPCSVLPRAGAGRAQRRTAVRTRLRAVRAPELRARRARCSNGSWVRWARRCAHSGREATSTGSWNGRRRAVRSGSAPARFPPTLSRMSHDEHPDEALEQRPAKLSDKAYDKQMQHLQRELVKLQEWVRHEQLKLCVLFEGRDAAGQGRHHQAHRRTHQPAGGAGRRARDAHREGEVAVVLPAVRRSTSRRAVRSCSSTGPGTTGPASST